MNILINASNLKKGGGVQVGDSICRELNRFQQHEFTVVLSSSMQDTYNEIKKMPNIAVCLYDLKNDWRTVLFGYDEFLDGVVKEKKIEAVLTIFGPSVWIPKCPHLCGFARAQLIMPESPYYTQMNGYKLIINRLKYGIRERAFKRCSNSFYTENPYTTERLAKKWSNKKVFTVTNYYNQVFDQPEKWREKKLVDFEGITLLTVTASYPHKNLGIAVEVAKVLRSKYPEFRFRFVITIDKDEYPANIHHVEDCFEFVGKVNIAECPSLYQQCDIVFQPTLMECFTASYPEAMRMERPIVTTDLEFAHKLCGEAAEYYSAVDADACAEAIYKVATDGSLRERLKVQGKIQLESFDNYNERARKLIELTAGESRNLESTNII